MKAGSRFAAVLLVSSALLLAGCSAAKPGADVRITVNSDGTIEQSIQVRGVELTPDDVSALQKAKWSVRAGSSESELSRRFVDLKDFATNSNLMARTLYSSLGSGLGRDLPATDLQVLTTWTSDLFLAKSYKVTYELPGLDVQPTRCSECGGDGEVTCSSCNGRGYTTCSTCDGMGYTLYTWYDGSTTRYTCSQCNGTGRITCDSCGGAGQVECSECGGSGKPSDQELQNYSDAVDKARLTVQLVMPGIAAKAEGPSAPENTIWEFQSQDAVNPVKVTATSWVVDWIRTGIAAAVLLLLLLLGGFLGVKRARAALADRAARKSAVRVTTPAAGASLGTNEEPCPSCGVPNSTAATFCRGCGAKLK